MGLVNDSELELSELELSGDGRDSDLDEAQLDAPQDPAVEEREDVMGDEANEEDDD